jgi:hypothetical protein
MAKGIFQMLTLFFCLLTLNCPAEAKSSRTIRLSDGEMAPIFVEAGYSTLLKFSSHPEPGLIGDQDGFKVEYMKSIVAIKPLVTKGKTNLFVFTKEGQFGFQLISARGKHDNVVYVEPQRGSGPTGPTATKTVVALDDMLTMKMNKTAKLAGLTLTLDSIATPTSRSTLLLRFRVQGKLGDNVKQAAIESKYFHVMQGVVPVKIENAFLEFKNKNASPIEAVGLILIRTAELKKNEPMKLMLSLQNKIAEQKPVDLQILFSADFRH